MIGDGRSNSMGWFVMASVLMHLLVAAGYHLAPVFHTSDPERDKIMQDSAMTEEERQKRLEELERERQEALKKQAQRWFESVVVPEVALGDPDSEATGLTWLGFKDGEPTEHASPNPSVVDQPEQKIGDEPSGMPSPGRPAIPSIPAVVSVPALPPSAPPAASTPEPASAVANEAPAEEVEVRREKKESPSGPEPSRVPQPLPAPEVVTKPTGEGGDEEPVAPPSSAPDAPTFDPSRTPERVINPELPVKVTPPVNSPAKPRVTEKVVDPVDPGTDEESVPEVIREIEATPPQTPTPNPTDAQPGIEDQPAVDGQPGMPEIDASPGEASDRESDFAAIKRAIRVEAGRLVSAKGMRVQTVRPQLSRFTRVMSPVDEAIVRVGFNKEGKVERTKLIRGTGNRDKDRPLIDALHKWRATGKPLEQLPETGEPHLVEVEFRVIF